MSNIDATLRQSLLQAEAHLLGGDVIAAARVLRGVEEACAAGLTPEDPSSLLEQLHACGDAARATALALRDELARVGAATTATRAYASCGGGSSLQARAHEP